MRYDGPIVVNPSPVANLLDETSGDRNDMVVIDARDSGCSCRLLVSDKVVGPLLPLSQNMVIREVVKLKASTSPDLVAFEYRQRKARDLTQMEVAGGEVVGGMDGKYCKRPRYAASMDPDCLGVHRRPWKARGQGCGFDVSM